MFSLRRDRMYTVAVAMDQLFTRIVITDMQRGYVTQIEKFELHLSKNPHALEVLAEKIEAVVHRGAPGSL